MQITAIQKYIINILNLYLSNKIFNPKQAIIIKYNIIFKGSESLKSIDPPTNDIKQNNVNAII